MNWKRGLLRLWIFVSILWLAGAGSIAVLESSPMQQQRRPLTEDELAACEAESYLDAEPIEPERPADFSQNNTPRTDAPVSSFGQSDTTLDTMGLTPLCSARNEYVRDWNLPQWHVMAVIFSVPALALGLGIATTWVIGGFHDPIWDATKQSRD